MRTRILRVLLFSAAALLSASLLPAQTLTIYYTASLRGNLDGCACERNRVAGLVKRAAFQRTVPKDALVLDTGDILDATKDPDLTREILAVYKELGYAAVGVGETELSEGAPALAANARRFPFLGHNLQVRPKAAWEPLSAKPLLLTRAGVRIAVLGVTEPKTLEGHKELKEGNLRLEDPLQTVARLAEESRRQGARLVIVLFHGEDAAARRLAEASPQVDLVLFGHAGWLVPPEKAGRALVSLPRGVRQPHRRAHPAAGPRRASTGFEHRMLAFSYEKDPDDPSVRERVRAYRKKLQERLRNETY